MKASEVTLFVILSFPAGFILGTCAGMVWSALGRLYARLRPRKRSSASSALAFVFVGTCGHTIGVPADLPPAITCPACGRQYVQTIDTPALPEPQPAPALADPETLRAQIATWQATLDKIGGVSTPAQTSGVRTTPPDEVFETIGGIERDELAPIEPLVIVTEAGNVSDIIDTSDEIDTSDIEETA